MFDPEVVTRLVERGVGGAGGHDVWLRNTPVSTVLAGGIDRQEDALGAAGGQRAGEFRRTEQFGCGIDHIEFHVEQGLVAKRVESVLVEEVARHVMKQFIEFRVVGVVDEAEGSAALPVDITAPFGAYPLGDYATHPLAQGASNCRF